MPRFLFLPDAASDLAVVLVTLLGLGYLLSIRDKSAATWCLIGVIGVMGALIGMMALMESWSGYWWGTTVAAQFRLITAANALAAAAGWCFMQFAYRFLDSPFPKEARIVGWAMPLVIVLLAAFVLAAETVEEWSRAASVLIAFVVLIFSWSAVVLLRKWRQARRAGEARAARAHLAYVAVIGALVVSVFAFALGRGGVIAGGVIPLITQVGFIAFFFGLVAVYLSHAPEPTSVQARLIGLGAVAVLIVVSAAATLVRETLAASEWDVGLTQTAVRYEPTPEGGYVLDRAPFTPSPTDGADLGLGDYASRPVALGFDFPFGGTRWDSAWVNPNGALAFGGPLDGPTASADLRPRILPLGTDFNPELGGAIRLSRADGRATFVWDGVPEFTTVAPSTFRVTLFESGAIEVTYDRVDMPRWLDRYGISRGILPTSEPLGASEHVLAAPTYPVWIAPGAAYIENLEAAARAEVQPLVRGLLWLALGAAALVIGAFLLAFRGSLIAPLRRLLDGVRRVDAGDFGAEVPVEVQDEFGRLAEGFNRMTASLREHTENLEDLVAERTAALEAAQAQLVHQEKMASLGALTAGIAHEIKNPLNFVTNFAGLSREAVRDLRAALADGDADEVEAILDDLALNTEKIEAHGKRADGIVRGMMEHARGGRGERRPVDLNALVDEHAVLAHHAHRARHPDADANVALDLGPEVGTVEVTPEEVGRVIVNLVDNALAAASGVGVARVTVSTRRLDDRVEVRVTDNGPGVPEAERARVFEPFYTTKPTGEGTGLGLSLAHDIVTQGHGGTLTVGAAEGGGAAFVVALPASGEAVAASTGGAAESGGAA